MKILFKSMIIICFGLLLPIIMGCSESVDIRQSGSSSGDELEAEQVARKASDLGNLELVGTVMKTGNTFMLISDEGDYVIAPREAAENGLSDAVGKRVKVEGILVASSAGDIESPVIDVTKLTEVE